MTTTSHGKESLHHNSRCQMVRPFTSVQRNAQLSDGNKEGINCLVIKKIRVFIFSQQAVMTFSSDLPFNTVAVAEPRLLCTLGYPLYLALQTPRTTLFETPTKTATQHAVGLRCDRQLEKLRKYLQCPFRDELGKQRCCKLRSAESVKHTFDNTRIFTEWNVRAKRNIVQQNNSTHLHALCSLLPQPLRGH